LGALIDGLSDKDTLRLGDGVETSAFGAFIDGSSGKDILRLRDGVERSALGALIDGLSDKGKLTLEDGVERSAFGAFIVVCGYLMDVFTSSYFKVSNNVGFFEESTDKLGIEA
jgi:hypothetical protein